MSFAQAHAACTRLAAEVTDDEQRKLLARVQRCLVRQQRELVHAKHRARAEVDLLRSELHSELVDREANAARVHERQRFLFEKQSALEGQLVAHDRAAASAAYLEAALVSLDVNTQTAAHGCEVLYAAAS